MQRLITMKADMCRRGLSGHMVLIVKRYNGLLKS